MTEKTMQPFKAGYSYRHPNGQMYAGVIEASSPDELKKLMQDELDASEGAMTAAAFVLDVPELAAADVLATTADLKDLEERRCPTCRTVLPSEVKR